MSVDEKIKQMEAEIKSKISKKELPVEIAKPVAPKPNPIIAKRKVPIRLDGTGYGTVICPKSEFGMDSQFCAGCRDWKGATETFVYCNFDNIGFIPRDEDEI